MWSLTPHHSFFDSEEMFNTGCVSFFVKPTSKVESIQISVAAWMTIHKYQYFSKEIGLQYCLEELGGYLSRSDMKTKDQTSLRAARMLITYLENGDFEYRAPRVEHFFSGEIGNAANISIPVDLPSCNEEICSYETE